MIKRFAALFLLCVLLCTALPASASEVENLVLGLEYTVETGEPVTMSHLNFSEAGTKFDLDNGQLTDGKTATNSLSADGWYCAFRGQSRIIGFDLGSVCAVSGIEAGFLHAKAPAVYAPRYVRVYISENGTDYMTVCDHLTGYDLTDTAVSRKELSLAFDNIYAARYVKVEFCCDIFAYCDEIRVLGSKETDGSEKSITPDKKPTEKGYLKSLGGSSNIIKLYNGYYNHDTNIGILYENEILPYVAYLDTNGNIAGKMFDAIALVPCHGDYPSGGRLVKTNGKPGAVMSDWELYFEYTFRDGQDLYAINNVAGRVNEALSLKDKYPVYLTIPYPTVLSDKPFGDIDGDGEEENCQNLEERLAIVKWYIDKCIEKFESKNYANIELAGFYWLREEVNYSDSDHEDILVIEVNEYIEKKRLDSIFDPFYLSVGFDEWEYLGFDGAVMQPNLAFSDVYSYFEAGMLEEFAQSVYDNHLGVEIETNEPSFFRGDDYLKAGFNYESYLYYGSKTGYMNSLKTYYQGAGPGSFYDFCYADISTPKGIYLRRLYDITYSFIHGVYKNLAPIVEIGDIELLAGDTRAMADISITDSDSYWGDITVSFPTEPSHGKVTVAASKKTLVYRPDDNFIGEDSFTVCVSDGFNKSEEITVTVTVNEAEISEVEITSQSSDDTSKPDVEENPVPVWLIAILCILGGAVVLTAVIMIVKRKK